MRKKGNIFWIFACLIFITLASCSEGEAYFRFHHIENGTWLRDSLLVFTIDSLSSTKASSYDVTVELTTNRSYPFRDIWLQIDQDLTDSLVQTDTLRFMLADENGKWLGSGTGGLNQLSFPYCSFTTRDTVYRYRLTVRQIMDVERLRGVEKVGIKLVARQ